MSILDKWAGCDRQRLTEGILKGNYQKARAAIAAMGTKGEGAKELMELVDKAEKNEGIIRHEMQRQARLTGEW